MPDEWGKRLSKEGLAARRVVIFFSIWLSVALLGLMSLESCSHANVRQAKEGCLPNAESASAQVSDGVTSSEGSSFPGKKRSKRPPEEIEAELDRMQQENSMLKEENEGLRAEILKLQVMLAGANQSIYALNRKLDAIFKPDEIGE